ncbi:MULTISPECIES: helix-turn-helix transcriptional regulator [Campylobacter]|uniref:Helix-turn-helix domain-containing protein n=2 Tax=Campylobacter TaxID=194 RepID=A0ABT7HR42_9BACT|nr:MULTISPECIES: helix-turn-helix domain-containing protein [Campylobacter]MDL0089192.1 helix-turn-helix domain-containing protein [Campylobacter gastrosuis]QCD44950.1 putative DNA binding protein, possible transcriptional regulator [Campylobacter mucosalis CCUG 21559]
MINDPITSKEACKLLSCAYITLWRYVKDGKFKKYAITPKTIRYSRSEILAFISSTAV